jgi:hypothetical protein
MILFLHTVLYRNAGNCSPWPTTAPNTGGSAEERTACTGGGCVVEGGGSSLCMAPVASIFA